MSRAPPCQLNHAAAKHLPVPPTVETLTHHHKDEMYGTKVQGKKKFNSPTA